MKQDLDLTNCDREPIHIPGSIQPFGFLLALLPDFTVAIASDNVKGLIGADHTEIMRRPIDTVFSQAAIDAIRNRVDYLAGPDAVERVFGLQLQAEGARFDIAIHFSGTYLVIEAEPSVAEMDVNSGELVRLMIARLRKTGQLNEFAQEAARQVKVLTGFDRVMVYRFHPDGSGEVIAEAAESQLESFLGLHYPASDIPKQARVLYERNWLRIIGDINDKPVRRIGADAYARLA